MDALRPVFASVLVAALAMGGVVLPVLHDAAHALERTEVELAHSDHHHHQLEDTHDAEAQPYCPDAAEVELVCAVCSTQIAAMLASSMRGQEVPAHQLGASDGEVRADADGITHTARGPPTA
ncbi:MAG: hypothetical protein Rubg2KO_16720 [Rubricoccaceae bacterium]